MFRAAAVMLAVAGPALAVPLAPGFDGGQVGGGQIGRSDDGFTDAQALGFSVNFFGATYSSAYVNNNGHITFGAAQDTYTPFGLGADYRGNPIIAPFFADVDTRNPVSGVTSYGPGTFAGRAAFGVTWPAVGYFDGAADKLNSFQGILVERSDIAAGDFDILFLYDQVQFETGNLSGGVGGLGGISASAGYSNGTGAAGTFAQLPGSLVNGALLDGGPNSLTANSLNTGIAGRYLFPVRGGVPDPRIDVPEPASLALLSFGLGVLSMVRRR